MSETIQFVSPIRNIANRYVNFLYGKTSFSLDTSVQCSYTKPSRLSKNINAIYVINSLKDDWDTYGAKAFDKKTVDNALHLLRRVVKQPIIVAPTGRGTIQFDFEKEAKYLELEIGKNTANVYWEGIDSDFPQEFSISFVEKDIAKVNELIEYVYR